MDYTTAKASKTQQMNRFSRGQRGYRSLIKNAVGSTLEVSCNPNEVITPPSPNQIIENFLTVAEHPSSRAYSLLTMRSILFLKFGAMPATILKHDYNEFTVHDLEVSYNSLMTSIQ